MRCEELGVLSSDRLFSPSAERNKGPISEVLSQVLPERGVVLEVGSGTGQHVVQLRTSNAEADLAAERA